MAESDDVSAIKSRLSAGSIRSIGNEQQANDRIGGTRTTTTSAKEMVAAGPNNNNKTVLNRTEGNGANCRPGQQQLCNMLICIVSISIASCCIWWPSEAQAQYYSPSSGATNHQYATPGSEHLAHFEQQYAAAAAAAAANQQQQHQQQQLSHQSPFPLAFNLISSASKTQQQPIVIESPQSVQPSASGPTAASGGGGSGAGQSRSTRSIGEMFKKLFNANKRSKQSSASSPSASLSSSPSTSRDWEQQQQQHSQQQHQQQQQFQQQQQQNQQAFAAQLAAAAANQHAVYASPYATAAATPGALYAQNPFAAGSYSPSYLTWPTASLAQAFRAPAAAPAAYLTAAQPQVPGGPQAGPPPQMTLTSSGPLFAAASQSYNSYVPAPNPAAQDGRPTGATVGGGGASSGANPVVAASQQHVSAVPAPPSMMNAAASSAHPSMVAPGQGVGRGSGGGGGLNSLDFYQVLDTLVRSSGFAPAGDNEAAYGSKDTDGTPVFSFKKLISMPFYLSTEDKSLDGLAPAGAGGPHQGYLPSMPIMRRHTRRMSTAGQQQQQQQAPASRSSQAASGSSSSSTSPYFIPNDSMASYQQYNTYINALNKQLAAMAASGNQQQQQYIDRHYLDMVAEISQKRPTTLGATTSTHQASTLDAMAADSALSNYYATLSSPNGGSLVGENGASRGALRSSQSMAADRMVASASMNPVVYAQQPPQQQQQPQQQQLQQQQHQGSQQQNQALAQRQSDEIQAIINNLPQLLAENADQQTYMTIPSGPASSFMETGNYRFGSSQPQSQNQQQQQQQQAYKGRLASSTNMVSQQQQGKQASNDLMTLINQSGLSGNNNSQQQPQQQPQQQQQADSNQKDSNQQLSDSTSASLAMSQQQQQLSSQLQQGQQQQVQGDSMQTQPSTMMSQQTAPVAGHHHHHHHHVVHNQMHQQQQGASALAPTPQSQSQASSSSSASTSLAAAAENNGQIVVVNGHHNQANGSPESSAPNQSVTGGSNGNNGASPIGLNQVSPFIGPGSA